MNSSFEHQEDIDARALIGSFKLQLSQDKNSESQENTRALSLNGLILPDHKRKHYTKEVQLKLLKYPLVTRMKTSKNLMIEQTDHRRHLPQQIVRESFFKMR